MDYDIDIVVRGRGVRADACILRKRKRRLAGAERDVDSGAQRGGKNRAYIKYARSRAAEEVTEKTTKELIVRESGREMACGG